MQSQTISVSVSKETATAFRAASPEKKKLVTQFVEALLVPGRRASLKEFRGLAEKANREAVGNGLTEEILHEILNEEEPILIRS